MLDGNVLLLNNNFEPLTVCTVKRAIIMVWSGKAEIIEATENYISSVSSRFNVPSIIRLLIYVRHTHLRRIQLTRQNILRRDRRTCQYCGTTEGHMTVDHIVPRSLGGRDTWENLVCACSSCNNRKGGRSPEQAGLRLIRVPRKPNARSFLFSRAPVSSTWREYLKIG